MKNNPELLKKYIKYANDHNISLNPDTKIVDAIINGLVRNEETKGKQYCPCRPLTGVQEQDNKIVCPCVFHLDEIKTSGKCHCGLFVRKK